METAAIFISGVSLLLSVITLYFSYLRSPKIEMSIGKSITFYPLPDIKGPEHVEWGGIAFYVPFTFQNQSNNGSCIEDVRLIIEHKGVPSKNYDMGWVTFVKIKDSSQLAWENKCIAQPIAVPGKNSVSEVVMFAWRVQSENKLKIESGEYSIKIVAWKSGDKKPSLKFVSSFNVSQEEADQHTVFNKQKIAMTISIPIGESSRVNTLMSRQQVQELYRI